MSRLQLDQFIDDDEEETCPLCVEEFDLSDKGFRPCPCGYQVCQFCYHNVRNNMNGLCPACRRPYDDSTIEFRKPNAEEESAWRAKQASRQKKTAVAQQKEVQKREADTLNRKHLAGLRVVQKNLVYVTGLSPSVQEDKLLETLRGQQYFGQYGKIVKIVVSKAKDNQASVGVYVTYARKEDAASCINAVDNSQNKDRTLRAQFGTTKYCSAYLRNEQCQNRNCMFLHEPGEDKDSFTRQDLSSMNVVSSTQHSQTTFPPSHSAPQSHAPPQSQQPVAAAAKPDPSAVPATPSETGPGPALPTSASWATRPTPSRSASRATTAAITSSPALSTATPAPLSLDATVPTTPGPADTSAVPSSASQAPVATKPVPQQPLNAFFQYTSRILSRPSPQLQFDDSSFTEEQKKLIYNIPSLIDDNAGRKRRLFGIRMEEERRRRLGVTPGPGESEDQLNRGSLQLGGEPEDQSDGGQQRAIHPPPQQQHDGKLGIDSEFAQLNLSGRSPDATQQQILLQQLQGTSAQNQGLQQVGLSNEFGQANPPGHARNVSRFSFANESSAGTSVKPVANSKLMSQQASMMPPPSTNASQAPFYTSTVSGPPPGLKTSGTPPVSGGGMFGQGHGFATGGLGYGSNMASRNTNDEMLRDLYRRRELSGQDPNKREYSPSLLDQISLGARRKQQQQQMLA